MASTEGLVPITRSFLASYYDKYPFEPLSADVSRLTSEIRCLANDLLDGYPPSQGERILIDEADRQPPHKIDENMWKNREHMEETVFLLERSNWPEGLKQQSTPDDVECTLVLDRLKDKVHNILKLLESFQAKNSDHVFNTGYGLSAMVTSRRVYLILYIFYGFSCILGFSLVLRLVRLASSHS